MTSSQMRHTEIRLGDVYCPGKYCLNREKCESIGGCVTTTEIHLWLWKVWSLVVCSQNSFYITRARKDDKNRQNTHAYSLLKEMSPDKQLFINVPFQSTKQRKKELCVDKKMK